MQLRAIPRERATSCSKLLRNKDLFLILGPSSGWRALAPVLPVWGVLAGMAHAQGGQLPAGQMPPDLPVTRLQGTGSQPLTAPAGPQAQAPGSLPSLPATQLVDRAAAADLDGPRRIALSLARPMPLRDMLLLLVNGTPFSLVTDSTVDGTFVGDLKDLTMRQALEAVLFPRGLDYDVQGTLIRVSPRRAETRLFPVNFLNQRRTWQRIAEGAGPPGRGAQISTTGGGDRFEDLESGVRALLSETGRMHVDRSSGVVQATDLPDRLDAIGVYLESVESRSLRQVRLDARVFEVTLSDPAAAGIDWAAAARGAGSGAGPRGVPPDVPPDVRLAGLTTADPAALLTAIGRQGTVEMVASPQVLAMNNEPALMRVGTRRAYFETTAEAGDGGGARRASSAATMLEGLTLVMTPQVAGDGTVQLSVAPSYAATTGEAKSAGGGVYPVMRIAEADTVLRVRDGETVVLSGFLRRTTRTRPATGLAAYFGAEGHETVTSELVILLTPAIVTTGSRSAAQVR